MRIERGQIIAGFPAIKIRNLLRRARLNGLSTNLLVTTLGISKRAASLVLNDLQQSGYVERTGRRWEVSEFGCRLCATKAIKPISRARADELVGEVLRRAEAIADDDRLLYEVEQLAVFGSYLTDMPELGDVDFALSMRRKSGVSWAKCEEFIHEAKVQGRTFKNYVDEICWPELFATQFLKKGLRSCSFQPWTVIEVLDPPFRMLVGSD